MDEYLSFYGFSENPFKVTPDPRFFFLSESHREALASVIYGINERKGFILISGERGIGKTSLIRYLSSSIGEKVPAVIIDQPDLPIEQLLTQIFLKLGLAPESQIKSSLIHQLNKYLIQSLARDENLAILIDDAHKLSKDAIEELRLLSNLETSSSKLLQIVLVGRPEIEAKLNSRDLRQFKQRIVIKNKMSRLTEEESRQYIDHHLKLVGRTSSEIFTPKALSLICRYAKGIPQAINTICDDTFRIRQSLSKKMIDTAIVRKTHKSLFRKISYLILVLVCLGAIIFLGKEYVESPGEKKGPHPPVQQPTASVKDTALKPEMKTDLLASKVDPTPPMKNPSTVPQPVQPVPASLASPLRPQSGAGGKTIIKVEKGDTLSALAKKYYALANTTLVDQIWISNPEIIDPNLIKVDQQIVIPEMAEASFISRSSDGTYKIYLGTFLDAGQASRYKNEPALKGKVVEITTRKISNEETWHRTMAGKFDTWEECLKTIQTLKQKGLFPALEVSRPH